MNIKPTHDACNQIGLLTKSLRTPFRICTSHGDEHIVSINSSRKQIKVLVLFDRNNPQNSRAFKYTKEDWLRVFEDYIDCLSDNMLSSLFVIAILTPHPRFDITEFSNAFDTIYNGLDTTLKERLLNDTWKLSFYASKKHQSEIAHILNRHNHTFVPSQEKQIIDNAIAYCEQISNKYNLREVNIFQKFIAFDNIIAKSQLQPSDNKLIQLIQWKNNRCNDFDFDTLRAFFYCFSLSSRWIIIRKLAYEKERRNIQITTDDLINLLESNTPIKEISDKYTGIGLARTNLSLELLIYSLDVYVKTGKFLSQSNVIEILNQIQERYTKINLGLHLLFNFCNGGLIRNTKYGKGSDCYLFDKADFLRNAPYSLSNQSMYECLKEICNGRLSSQSDEVLQKSFLWCNGHPCFRSVIGKFRIDNACDYRYYNLSDLCKAFGKDIYIKTDCGLIPNDELSKFIDTLSKLFRITSHMYCESCKQLLFPDKRSDKEFINTYNTFSCQNPKCNQHGVKIYLSHCHTKSCKGVIDSRHLKQCPNGMYICPECFGCCSDGFYKQQIEFRRIYNLPVSNALEVQIAKNVGHNDKGIFYCYKCGDQLIDNKCPTCNIEFKSNKRYKYQ